MSVSSVSFNTDVNVRYDRLSSEYAKLRSHAKVLSEGIISERKKNECLNESVRELEAELRKMKTENESLTFRNDQLVKRVERLQDEMEASAHVKAMGTREGRSLRKSKDTRNLSHELEILEHRASILEEELQDKIRQNMELTGQINELNQKHDEERSSLLNEIARNVEQAESKRLHSNKEKHRPERPVKSVKPLEQSLEVCGVPSIPPSPQPPPLNDAYLQVAESIRNTLQADSILCLSTLFELLYQRTQLYPFDASMEALPSHIKVLSSGLAQCSQLLTVPIDIVEQCILKAEFQWSTDVPQLHSGFSPIVKHCKVMMPELLKRLSIEENKITWCDSKLEELNTAWCAGMCRLFVAMESVCAVLDITPYNFNGIAKLCETLEEGSHVIRELDTTFSTRWALESRFPTATKRIRCIGTTTCHCLSRLASEIGKLSARVRAISELLVDNDKQGSMSLEQRLLPCNITSIEHDCDIAQERKSGVEEQSFCSRGVDTSDLDSGIVGTSDICHVPSNSSDDPHFSMSEASFEQTMMDCLKEKVSALESERESHLVDLSLLRRKLAHLGVKEVKDDNYSEIEMLKQVNRERLRAVTDNLQIAQSTANYYKGECAILLRKNFVCMNEKRVLEETVENITKKVVFLKDELASVRRSYDEQLSQMTEHIANLNGKLANMESEKVERRCPAVPQRGGLKSLFMK